MMAIATPLACTSSDSSPASSNTHAGDGGTPDAQQDGGAPADADAAAPRPYFDAADWLWDPIPDNPVLDPNSGNMVTELSASGQSRILNTVDFGVSITGPAGIDGSTPRYDIPFTMIPDWGSDPFGLETMPIPDGTVIPPGSDGHVCVADATTKKVYCGWQTTHSGSTWGASWGGLSELHGDGREYSGSSTAPRFSQFGTAIRIAEIEAGVIEHAISFSTNMAQADVFRYPATKTDGDNVSGAAHPIPEGARVQLDPSIDLDAIPGITKIERIVGKALQRYGAYCADKGGARMAFVSQYTGGTSPDPVYQAAGVEWDYWAMNHLPWSSLRVLQSWNGQ